MDVIAKHSNDPIVYGLTLSRKGKFLTRASEAEVTYSSRREPVCYAIPVAINEVQSHMPASLDRQLWLLHKPTAVKLPPTPVTALHNSANTATSLPAYSEAAIRGKQRFISSSVFADTNHWQLELENPKHELTKTIASKCRKLLRLDDPRLRLPSSRPHQPQDTRRECDVISMHLSDLHQ